MSLMTCIDILILSNPGRREREAPRKKVPAVDEPWQGSKGMPETVRVTALFDKPDHMFDLSSNWINKPVSNNYIPFFPIWYNDEKICIYHGRGHRGWALPHSVRAFIGVSHSGSQFHVMDQTFQMLKHFHLEILFVLVYLKKIIKHRFIAG